MREMLTRSDPAGWSHASMTFFCTSRVNFSNTASSFFFFDRNRNVTLPISRMTRQEENWIKSRTLCWPRSDVLFFFDSAIVRLVKIYCRSLIFSRKIGRVITRDMRVLTALICWSIRLITIHQSDYKPRRWWVCRKEDRWTHPSPSNHTESTWPARTMQKKKLKLYQSAARMWKCAKTYTIVSKWSGGNKIEANWSSERRL